MNHDDLWKEHAACKAFPRPEYDKFWFPIDEDKVDPEARAICASCPVQVDCLEAALRNQEPDGFWGGKTTKERRAILRKRNPKPKRVWLHDPEWIKCLYCQRVFDGWDNSTGRKQDFDTRECARKHRALEERAARPTRNCEHCGKSFDPWVSMNGKATQNLRIYCDEVCRKEGRRLKRLSAS